MQSLVVKELDAQYVEAVVILVILLPKAEWQTHMVVCSPSCYIDLRAVSRISFSFT